VLQYPYCKAILEDVDLPVYMSANRLQRPAKKKAGSKAPGPDEAKKRQKLRRRPNCIARGVVLVTVPGSVPQPVGLVVSRKSQPN